MSILPWTLAGDPIESLTTGSLTQFPRDIIMTLTPKLDNASIMKTNLNNGRMNLSLIEHVLDCNTDCTAVYGS